MSDFERVIAEANEYAIRQAEKRRLEEADRNDCPALEEAKRVTAREVTVAVDRSGKVGLAQSYHDRKAYTLRDSVLRELGFPV